MWQEPEVNFNDVWRLEMPQEFPVSEMERLHSVTESRVPKPHLASVLGAENAIVYRYLGLRAEDQAFAAAIQRYGPSTTGGERYEQDQALFDFFSNAFSLFDTFGYLAHHVAASTNAELASRNERSVSFASTARELLRLHPTDGLAHDMSDVAANAEFSKLDDGRRLQFHRYAIARHHFLGGPASGTAEWRLSDAGLRNVELNDRLTGDSVHWIDSVLPELVQSAHRFADQHLPR